MILVVIDAGETDRVSEGLRAGLGLGLRGDDVAVALTGRAAHFAADGAGDAGIARALRTLADLARPAQVLAADQVADHVRDARAVEVWTSGTGQPATGNWQLATDVGSRSGLAATAASDSGSSSSSTSRSPRRLQVGTDEIEVWPVPPRFRRCDAGGRALAVDGADLVAQILSSDGPVVLW